MDWLKKNFDRVILAIIGLAVAAFAAMIILNTLSFGEVFESQNSTKKPDNTLPAPATDQVQSEIAALTKPAEWGSNKGSLFVSEPYIIRGDDPDANPIGINDSDEMVFPPIENQWILDNHLAFGDSNLPNNDPDNDKFTNLEEFLGKTDPNDPNAQPPYYTKLRLMEFIRVPFRLKFSGSPDNGETFSINTLDLKQPTSFLTIGEMVPNTSYKLVDYVPKTDDSAGYEKDISELIVENQETGQKVTLVYDTVVDEPTVFAQFKYLWDGSEFKVKKNDTFSVEPEPNVKYKLIDISDTEALIENVQSKEQFTVPKDG